jgi:DNA-binding beta-propeller fold protein YncE
LIPDRPYDEIWIQNSGGAIHTFDVFGKFLNGQNSWGSMNSFTPTGSTVSFVGSMADGRTLLLENALTTLVGRSTTNNEIAVPFVPFDIAYDPTTATTRLLDRSNLHLTTGTYVAAGFLPADPGLTLASLPYQIALDVARGRVYVVEPGRSQVEVFNYKTRKRIGALL